MWPLPQEQRRTRENFIFNPAIDRAPTSSTCGLDENIGNSEQLFFKYSWDDTY